LIKRQNSSLFQGVTLNSLTQASNSFRAPSKSSLKCNYIEGNSQMAYTYSNSDCWKEGVCMLTWQDRLWLLGQERRY
jgi:hypothetical protein